MSPPTPARVTLETHAAIAPLIRGMFDPARLGGSLGAAPDAAALTSAERAFRAELNAQREARAEALRESMERSLIAGVTLGPLELEVGEVMIVARARFVLDDLRKLPLIRVSFEPDLPRERPFEHFRVTEAADELRLTGRLEAFAPPREAAATEGVGGQGLAIELPRPARSSNAHRVDASAPNRLEWYFDLAQWAQPAPWVEAVW